jgi:hypothetical protein
MARLLVFGRLFAKLRIAIPIHRSIRAPLFTTRPFTSQERCLLAFVPGLATEDYDVLWVWICTIQSMKEKARSRHAD